MMGQPCMMEFTLLVLQDNKTRLSYERQIVSSLRIPCLGSEHAISG